MGGKPFRGPGVGFGALCCCSAAAFMPQGSLLLPEHPVKVIWIFLWLQVLAWAADLALVGALEVSKTSKLLSCSTLACVSPASRNSIAAVVQQSAGHVPWAVQTH